MKRRLIVIGILFAMVTLGAVAIGTRGQDPPVPLVAIGRSDFQRQVTAEGNLRAVNATPLSPPTSAPSPLKIAWIADDGAPVGKGEVVVRFDPTDFETQLLTGSRSEASTGNRLSRARVQSGTVRHNLSLDAEQAQREYEAALQFERRDEDVFSRHELIESEIDGALALERREYAEGVLGVRQELSETERALLAIEMRTARMQIDKAERGLEALELVAPHDGILVLERDWRGEVPRVGATVWPGRSLGEIPDLAEMEAEVYILEADAGGIDVGMAAEVVVEAKPEVVWKGTISRVDKVARQRFRGVPLQYFGVTISLDETEPSVMKPGTRVRATIQVENRSQVLTVPRQAIFEREGKKVVHRWLGDRFEEVPVEIEGGSAGVVVVGSGLSAGDRIALRDPLANGSRRSKAD